MAQKKKKNRKQGHPGRQQQHGIPAPQAAVGRAMDRITPEFLRWYEATQDDDGLGMPYQLVMRSIFGVIATVEGAVSVTAFDPRTFAEVLETIVGVEQEAENSIDGVDAVSMVLGAVATYVDFLDETGRWGGTKQDLELLQSLIERVMVGQDIRDDESADLSSTEELALGDLNGMKAVELGRDLVRWIGEGRAIQAGGELAEDEARQAIELVESRVALSSSTPQDLLLRLYLSLALAEVIELGERQVVPTAGAPDFLSGDPSVAFGSLFSFVHAFLEESMAPPELGDDEAMEAWELVCETLDRAAMGVPLAVGAPAPKTVASRTWRSVVAQLEEFAELGLVEKGTHYDVPLAVGALLEDLFDDDDEELEDEEQEDEDLEPGLFAEPSEPGESNVIQLPNAAQPETGAVLQLKVGIDGSKPPIWRRVLVREDMSLAILHQVIQVSFRWNDEHLHEFAPRAVPVAGLPKRSGALDEDAVTVGQVLRSEKDRLGYVYDHGDDWRLTIILEKILEDEQGAVPRCTGGRRMAPVENSGGIFGWEHMLQSINDPSHELHEEHREWLGLEDGEELDASAFDSERINRTLAYFG